MVSPDARAAALENLDSRDLADRIYAGYRMSLSDFVTDLKPLIAAAIRDLAKGA